MNISGHSVIILVKCLLPIQIIVSKVFIYKVYNDGAFFKSRGQFLKKMEVFYYNSNVFGTQYIMNEIVPSDIFQGAVK